jgi:hypothetical protein
MRKSNYFSVFCALCLALTGCSPAQTTPSADTWAEDGSDASDDLLSEPEALPEYDLYFSDLGQYGTEMVAGETISDDLVEQDETDAESLPDGSCNHDQDCGSGLCVEEKGGRFCATLCRDECAPGSTCTAGPERVVSIVLTPLPPAGRAA